MLLEPSNSSILAPNHGGPLAGLPLIATDEARVRHLGEVLIIKRHPELLQRGKSIHLQGVREGRVNLGRQDLDGHGRVDAVNVGLGRERRVADADGVHQAVFGTSRVLGGGEAQARPAAVAEARGADLAEAVLGAQGAGARKDLGLADLAAVALQERGEVDLAKALLDDGLHCDHLAAEEVGQVDGGARLAGVVVR